jgi:hypothetical protein
MIRRAKASHSPEFDGLFRNKQTPPFSNSKIPISLSVAECILSRLYVGKSTCKTFR